MKRFLAILFMNLVLPGCSTDAIELVPFSGMTLEAVVPEATLPMEATTSQREFDQANREHWGRILAGIERILDDFDAAFQTCPSMERPDPNSPPGDSGQAIPFNLGEIRKKMIAASEWVNHELAQLDPMQNRSALFVPVRTMNRNIRTVLFSALELSCRSPELFSGRMKATRQRLLAFREHLDLP